MIFVIIGQVQIILKNLKITIKDNGIGNGKVNSTLNTILKAGAVY